MSRPVPLPVLTAAPGRVTCTECGRCCTYVSVGINAPRTLRFASDILWFLYHEKVSVYQDGDGDWSVVFDTVCRNLGPERMCRVYADRPLICRDFDDTTCEINAPSGGIGFEDAETFLRWLRGARRRLFDRLMERAVPPELRARVQP